MLNPEWVGKDPRDDAVAERFLFHDCPVDLLPWALATRRVFVARRAMTQVFRSRAWRTAGSASIVCSDDRTIAPQWSRRVARERLQVEPVELPGGHCPHVSRPDALAEQLNRVALALA